MGFLCFLMAQLFCGQRRNPSQYLFHHTEVVGHMSNVGKSSQQDAAGVRPELAQMETTLEGEWLPWAVVTLAVLFLPSTYIPAVSQIVSITFFAPQNTHFILSYYTTNEELATWPVLWSNLEKGFCGHAQIFGCNLELLLRLLFETVHQPKFSSGFLRWAIPEIYRSGWDLTCANFWKFNPLINSWL